MARKKSEVHPRITPLRALALLEKLTAASKTPDTWLLDELKTAFRNHIMAELTRRNRRRSNAST